MRQRPPTSPFALRSTLQALRECVKLDTAPYRRHAVVLSPRADVGEAKKRLGLQVQVCRGPDTLAAYLGWLQEAVLAVAGRERPTLVA